MTTSSPGSVRPRTASTIASDTPHVIVTSSSGSMRMSLKRAHLAATACRNAGDPQVKEY